MFKEMEEEVKTAIFERLHQKVFVTGCKILRIGCPAKQMYFILRGSLSCVNQDGFRQEIGAGHFCGEELLIWHLEQNPNNIRSGMTLLRFQVMEFSRKCIAGAYIGKFTRTAFLPDSLLRS